MPLILATQEAKIWKIKVQGQPGKSNKNLGVMVWACHHSYSGSINKRIIL
jgi:hypothetical protein